jgi:hypothetical protein
MGQLGNVNKNSLGKSDPGVEERTILKGILKKYGG